MLSIKNEIKLKDGKLSAYIDEENGEVGVIFTTASGDIIDLFHARATTTNEEPLDEGLPLANRNLSSEDCDMIHIRTFADPTTEDPTGDSYLSVEKMNELTQ